MALDKTFSDKTLQDFKLIDKALEGDQSAYAQLMDHYNNSLYHTILKMVRNVDDAEDLTIEAFAKAFRSLASFKKNHAFSTWLFRIGTNNCIDFLRKKRLNTYRIDGFYEDAEGGSRNNLQIKDNMPNPQEVAIKAQKSEIIHLFINKLPPKYRRLVQLRYFKELSYQEISDELSLPLGTVKAQLFRAKELLQGSIISVKDHI